MPMRIEAHETVVDAVRKLEAIAGVEVIKNNLLPKGGVTFSGDAGGHWPVDIATPEANELEAALGQLEDLESELSGLRETIDEALKRKGR